MRGQGRPWVGGGRGGGGMSCGNWNGAGMQGGGQWNDGDAEKYTPFTDSSHFDVSKECDPGDWSKPLVRNEKLERYVCQISCTLLCPIFICEHNESSSRHIYITII